VLGVIPSAIRRKGLVGSETFSIVVTSRQLVFALMSQQMMNDAIRQAAAEAQQQGKGLLGRMSAQMGWMKGVMERYRAMPAEEALGEHAENFAIPLKQIKRFRVGVIGGEEDDDEGGILTSVAGVANRKYELEIASSSGVYKFMLGAAQMTYARHGGLPARETEQLLQEALEAA
jgi:hypothetical protein